MIASPKLWLTYAWADNDDRNVDHIVGKLRSTGIDVYLDREQLRKGHRLWTQIDKFISYPASVDAWAIYVTRNALESEPCQEKLAYALDRALRARGGSFPVIGIFKDRLPREIIPSSIATRLYVHLSDTNWHEDIAASLTGAPLPRVNDPGPVGYELKVIDNERFLIAWPRIGYWPTAAIAFPEGVFTSTAMREKRPDRPVVAMTRFTNGSLERSGMWNLGERRATVFGVASDVFTLGGPFDSIIRFAVKLPSYKGRVAVGGVAGDKFLDLVELDIS
ncbi:toll/interleukin-1 receptor domain-containing protein [Glycocaulis abyssi]|uniref:Toll/interleukin-1 receptor domain-containing protein n=1 Tax=Glycocaulis abyssi TaxID=1433403 RepID=A0ABV9NB32_9PROT